MVTSAVTNVVAPSSDRSPGTPGVRTTVTKEGLRAHPSQGRSVEGRSAQRRGGRFLARWITTAILGFTIPCGAVLGLAFAFRNADFLGSKRIDRTGPALLSSITALSDYRAASGQFTVMVDIEEDAKWLPDAIRGERTLLLANGSVDAGVDFSRMNAESITVDEASKHVTIRVPAAKLRKPLLDLDSSRVVEHKRGLLDRLGTTFGDAPSGENKALRLAEKKLADAAKASSVVRTAEDNTRAMLTSMVQALGYKTVTVEFVPQPGL